MQLPVQARDAQQVSALNQKAGTPSDAIVEAITSRERPSSDVRSP